MDRCPHITVENGIARELIGCHRGLSHLFTEVVSDRIAVGDAQIDSEANETGNDGRFETDPGRCLVLDRSIVH
jgi:hypothetical protein